MFISSGLSFKRKFLHLNIQSGDFRDGLSHLWFLQPHHYWGNNHCRYEGHIQCNLAMVAICHVVFKCLIINVWMCAILNSPLCAHRVACMSLESVRSNVHSYHSNADTYFVNGSK